MGLDISYFSQLAPAPDVEDGPVERDKYVRFFQSELDWTEMNWPGHSDGIKAGVYSFAESGDFKAGSYSYYTWWRDQLARFALGKPAVRVWTENPSGPFIELIHFADNEGVIGPKMAAKLAKDFADYEDRAIAYAAKGARRANSGLRYTATGEERSRAPRMAAPSSFISSRFSRDYKREAIARYLSSVSKNDPAT
jgi:hypothetical protein